MDAVSQKHLFLEIHIAQVDSWSWGLTWPYLGMHLGTPNMVKWGIPEKILQNAVQSRRVDHDVYGNHDDRLNHGDFGD